MRIEIAVELAGPYRSLFGAVSGRSSQDAPNDFHEELYASFGQMCRIIQFHGNFVQSHFHRVEDSAENWVRFLLGQAF